MYNSLKILLQPTSMQWLHYPKYFLYFCTSEHNKSYNLIGQIWRIKLLYSPTGEYNKNEIFKMAASRFVEVYW
jgi:hypothetical protein